MIQVSPSQFNTAAELSHEPYQWKDDGDHQIEPGEVYVDEKVWRAWKDITFQKRLNAIVQRAKDILVFPPSIVDPVPAVYERVAGSQSHFDPKTFVKKERLAQRLLDVLPLPSKSCQEGVFTNYAKKVLTDLGASVQIDDFPQRVKALSEKEQASYTCINDSKKTLPTSGNLIGVIAGDPALPSWNLSFHLDTNQLTFDGFVREGDIIKPAPGTPLGADDKAGFAIITEVLHILQSQKIPHGDIRIVGEVGEERGNLGAKLIEGTAFKGDLLVNIDGQAYNHISLGATTLYAGTFTVETHTSHPAAIDKELAVDACAVGRAILEKAEFRWDGHPGGDENVVLLSDFQSCGTKRSEQEGGVETTSWGIPMATPIRNTVPGFFTARWQMRSLKPRENAIAMAAQLKQTMNAVCANAAKGRTAVTCHVTGTDNPIYFGYLVDADAPTVRLLQSGYAMIGATPPTLNKKQFGGTVGNIVSERFGEEIILMDTGASQIHTTQETVDCSKMTTVAMALLGAMLQSYTYRRVR